MPNKKICIIYTGGTIGSVETPNGFATAPRGVFTEMLTKVVSEYDDLPEYEIYELKKPIDSSSATPDTWTEIATNIADRYEQYEGFIVLHGTDTLAYSATALSYMLGNLNKPVVFTGSQIPLSQKNNDAENNIINSMRVASSKKIIEVCICFGSKVVRANRATKVHANDFLAFDAPNGGLLASVTNSKLIYHPENHKTPSVEPFEFRDASSSDVIILKFFPGITANFVARILHPAPQGVVLECYGAGHPPLNQEILAEIKATNDKGTVFVNITQCYAGKVNMDTYVTGTALAKTGTISGSDMTTEAAFVKLSFLLGQDIPSKKVKELMHTAIADEIIL